MEENAVINSLSCYETSWCRQELLLPTRGSCYSAKNASAIYVSQKFSGASKHITK